MTATTPAAGGIADPTAGPVPPDAAFVVVGGGPTGHAAVTAYRAAGGTGRVVLFSADEHPPYNRPPLSKDFLRAESDTDTLPLAPDTWYAANGVELVLRERVRALDLLAHTVTTSNGRVERFGTCLLATGSVPVELSVPGAELALPLRFLTQAQRLRDAAGTARRAVVIGSGFIGCEAAASLRARDVAVTMISSEPSPQQARLGDAASARISGWLTAAGVQIIGDAKATEVTAEAVVLDDGRSIPADLVLAAVGVEPQSELAERAGLAVSDHRIEVDEQMRTADPRVLAAGDVALARNGGAGRALPVEHWGEAERMGEVAGTVAAGGTDSWDNVPGFWSEIGEHTLKYAAWGDGFDDQRLVEHDGGGFTVWYSRDGVAVGVLTSEADDDYERGQQLIAGKQPPPG